MAIYTKYTEAVETGKHGIVRLSRLKASDVGRIYDLLVENASGEAIAVDRGTALKVGAKINDGLQVRKATIAKTTDKIVVVSNPATIKDAFTRAQEEESNYYVKAGEIVKAHEVVTDDQEVFGVADYQFSTVVDSTNGPQFGNYVVVDGNGGYVELAAMPDVDTYGYIGQIIGFETSYNTDFKAVLIECIQNVQL